MVISVNSKFLRLLHDTIDPTIVPFSTIGSRLLVYKDELHDRLFFKLAERMTDIYPGIETYLNRPPFIQELYFIDDAGTPLSFHLSTYPHALFFRTRIGNFTLTFDKTDNIVIGLPDGERSGIQLRANTQSWEKNERGGCLKGTRILVYLTNGFVLKNKVGTDQHETLVEFIVDASESALVSLNIGLNPDVNNVLIPFSQSLASAEERWHNWFSSVPSINGSSQLQYYYAWWVIGNNLVSPRGHVLYEAVMPSKVQYVGIWNWDACFHAIALRYIDPELARDQLRLLLAHQLPNGMIPDAIFDEGVVIHIDHPISGWVTKPPIMAYAAMKLHQSHPDRSFLEEIYPSLVHWNNWWFSENDDDGDGIVQYTHPYSSGLDDSPLWDHGLPVESPDLNTYLCIQMQSLAEMAQELGLQNEATNWQQRSEALIVQMVKHFYDPDAGLFWATHNHQPIPELTPFNIYPLWTGQLDEEINKRLIAHLTNPDEFWAPYPLTTVARNSKSYSPEIMWRGPAWANINYFIIEALRKSGYLKLAQKLRERTVAMLTQNNGIYEFYNPETGRPAKRTVPMFGWSAAVLIDLLLQE